MDQQSTNNKLDARTRENKNEIPTKKKKKAEGKFLSKM